MTQNTLKCVHLYSVQCTVYTGLKTSADGKHIIEFVSVLVLSFLPQPPYHLDSYKTEFEALVSCSMVQSLLKVSRIYQLHDSNPPTFHTLHPLHCTAHCKQETVHYTLYTTRYTLHTAHCTLHTRVVF